MIFPDDLVPLGIILFSIVTTLWLFIYRRWGNRRAREKDELSAWRRWHDIGWGDSFVAVLRYEWRWVGEMDPWMEKPWKGTKYEDYWEEIYLVYGRGDNSHET